MSASKAKHERVRFGRFRMSAEASKRISRATIGDACFEGTWLCFDGKVAKRTLAGFTSAELDRAQVKLGFGRLDHSTSPPSRTKFCALVPYRATHEEIRAGWLEVAVKIEAHERCVGRSA